MVPTPPPPAPRPPPARPPSDTAQARILTKLRSKYRRVVSDAWEKAQSTKNYAAAAAAGSVHNAADRQITLSEACQILNVRPLQNGKTDMDIVMARFKRLFDVNEPDNGGSLYLQSKVLRARQRIEQEVRKNEEKEERERELERGWKPTLFRK